MKHDDKLTIVGPEPEKKDFSFISSVNIEAVLLMAKYDKKFRKLLFKDREKALEETGIPFTKNELLLIKQIDQKQLKKTISSFEIKGINKHSLSNWKKAASVILLISGLISSTISCSENVKGITQDEKIQKDQNQTTTKPEQKPRPYDEDRITRGISIDRFRD